MTCPFLPRRMSQAEDRACPIAARRISEMQWRMSVWAHGFRRELTPLTLLRSL